MQIEQLETRPHVERLTEHVKARLTVTDVGNMRSVSMNVLLDIGSGVTKCSEELVTQMRATMPRLLPLQLWRQTYNAPAPCRDSKRIACDRAGVSGRGR